MKAAPHCPSGEGNTWAQTSLPHQLPFLPGSGLAPGWVSVVILFMPPSPRQLRNEIRGEEPSAHLTFYLIPPQGDVAEATQPGPGI